MAHAAEGDWELSGAELYARLTAPDAPPQLRLPVQEALGAIQAALRLYGPDRLLLSFNGGKDATVVLHLARAAYAAAGLGAPQCVYWEDSACFPEVSAFVAETAARYGLPLLRYSDGYADGMRDAVERQGVAAVLLGTRTGDPNGLGADTFQPSSEGWPAFMRVNPLLRWAYHDVWRLLLGFRLPFCALYAGGYTSLGNAANTRPNPALLRPDGTYSAADALLSAALERGGRGADGCAAVVDLTRTAGLVIIGNSAFAGMRADETVAHTAERLRKRGGHARLTRVAIVAGSKADIADAVRGLSSRCDVVLLSGASDAAYDAAASAFGLRLYACAQLGGTPVPEGAQGGAAGMVSLRIRSNTVMFALGDDAQFRARLEAACDELEAQAAGRVL